MRLERPRFLWVGPKAEVEARLPVLEEKLTRAPAGGVGLARHSRRRAAHHAADVRAVRAADGQLRRARRRQFPAKAAIPGRKSSRAASIAARSSAARRWPTWPANDTVQPATKLFHSDDPGQPCGMVVNAAPAPGRRRRCARRDQARGAGTRLGASSARRTVPRCGSCRCPTAAAELTRTVRAAHPAPLYWPVTQCPPRLHVPDRLRLAARCDASDGRPLLTLAANRDEFFRRDTEPLALVADAPDVLAGRDLAGGGTWLGVTRDGRFAALTNYRAPREVRPDAPTRGTLVSDCLADAPGRAARTTCDLRGARGTSYNGFNLLVGDFTRRELAWYGNRADAPPSLLDAGMHGIVERLLDTPWPKLVAQARRDLATCSRRRNSRRSTSDRTMRDPRLAATTAAVHRAFRSSASGCCRRRSSKRPSTARAARPRCAWPRSGDGAHAWQIKERSDDDGSHRIVRPGDFERSFAFNIARDCLERSNSRRVVLRAALDAAFTRRPNAARNAAAASACACATSGTKPPILKNSWIMPS